MRHAAGHISRRQFLGQAAALGVAMPFVVGRLGRMSPLIDEVHELSARAAQARSRGLTLRASGSALVNATGLEVRLTGVSWFGLEMAGFAPHGLGARNLRDMLDQIVQTGFNIVRLPYSNQLLDPASQPSGIDYQLNPGLNGLNGLEVMDYVIQTAGQCGLKVILDRHRPDAATQSALWYTDRVPERRWIADWVRLAERYRHEPTVIGADLHNEPHNPATWGDGNIPTDWRLAAERAGNAILAANPDWLIIVQGIQQYGDIWACWGGNLAGAGDYPVRLARPEKLVYSPHDFGPSIAWQSWFSAPNFPANLPAVWERRWGYLRTKGVAPVWLGEFGGRSMGQDVEGRWQQSLVSFLKERGISYAYWAWNPDSGDTGGMLEDDWRTVNQMKLRILSAYQAPLLA